MTSMRIGSVARASGLSVETIRYYERRGLLKAPTRSLSGYREYPPQVVDRLAFIRRGKHLGFSLDEIKELLDLELSPQADSATVKGLVEEKVLVIEARIAELSRLKQTLAELSSRCDGQGSTDGCPILRFLKAGADSKANSAVYPAAEGAINGSEF